MWVLLAAMLLLGILSAIIGYFQYLKQKRQLLNGEISEIEEPKELDVECCGSYSVCEKDSLLAAVSKSIEYYDDEELDCWRGTPSNCYPNEAIERFRDIFYELQSEEVAGWVRSLQLREINLPDEIKDEVLLVVGERRIAP